MLAATMKFGGRSSALRGSLAVALASPHFLPSLSSVTNSITVTAFSINVQPTRAVLRDDTIVRRMSKMDQSFPTWSYDEPCKSMEWSELVTATVQCTAETVGWDDDADLVMVGVFAPKEDDEESEEEESDKEEKEPTVSLEGGAKALDEKLGGALSQVMLENAKDFNHGAKAGSCAPTFRVVSEGKTRRYIVVGLGSTPKEDDDKALQGVGFTIGATVASQCNTEKQVKSAKILLPESITSDASILTDFTTSFYADLYSDNRYRTGKKVKKAAESLETVTIVGEGSIADDADTALDNGKKIATGVFMAKDIVNAPHNVLNSLSLAETAKRIAEESGGTLKCKILGKKECEERGMGAYLGVARASETEPQFIHLTYTPPGEVVKKVGVIGKGLLFDTGGYNIKTQMMELMKFDCGGSAAVLGAARSVAALAPPGVEVHFVVAACENMINGKGVVPSDILTASNGKTIEVLNTDAEGRLTMADALVYCDKELDCESIIELSTLTGACMVALGQGVCGLWSDNDDLASELEDISKVTGDKAWRMPMEKSYNEQLESKIADIKNIGTRYGGAITAALFLQNFVDKKKPFAHLDIAGPVWNEKMGGATGFGAKIVIEWVRRQGLKKDKE